MGMEDGEDMMAFLLGVILCVISGCLRIRQAWPRIVYTIIMVIWSIEVLSYFFDEEMTSDMAVLLALFGGATISGLVLAWQSVVGKWIAK